MKKKLVVCIALLLVAFTAFAAITGDAPKTYGIPMLITNAGQGPGGKMARLLASQAKTIVLDTDYFYCSEPQQEDIVARPYSSVMVVIGSTDKGLGASGITIDQEIARLEKMVQWCKDANIPMIGVLLEKDKRAPGIKTNANERCIDTIAPYCEWLIVVKDGNKDGRFTEISKKYNIPLTILDNSIDFTNLIKVSYPK